ICLVLIQRGRGGGLAGAFGGLGGSSAFGTRAGDVFTRVTIVTASVWIALNMGLVVKANRAGTTSEFLPPPGADAGTGAPTVPDLDDRDLGAPADGDADADAPVDLPPALDGGQPPNADDADLNVDEPPGSD